MPDLLHTLQGSDLGFLRMVAGLWGVELEAPDAYTALPVLVKALNSRLLVKEIVDTLPSEARAALQALLDSEARLPWTIFCRKFGEVRPMGAARRERERPDLKPASPAETLWYRALVGKAFLNIPPAETQEYAFIPDDLLDCLAPLQAEQAKPFGRPATPGECASLRRANDRIIDHACTLLAALRMGADLSSLDTRGWTMPLAILRQLLAAADLVDEHGQPNPENARAFLESSRGEALASLAHTWMSSPVFNDLRLLPGLVFEGEWANHPLEARQAVLGLLSHLPQDSWWNLNSFVAAVKERQPDFQRLAGEYDAWFIRKENNETYLRGFTSWDEVDGVLLRFYISGPLHWLGLLDLAAPADGEEPSAFRPSAWAESLWHGKAPDNLSAENEPLTVNASGHLSLPRLFPRAIRYQVARFCQWEAVSNDIYHYRLTPSSLERARNSGLRTAQLTAVLRRHANGPLPPNLIQALERLETSGVQARLDTTTLLRVTAPEILNDLRKTRAARYLGEMLNPTTILVKPGGEEAVRSALAEIGYLGESFST